MEELQIKCTGDLAVIAAHVQTVLAAEPGLAWLVETNAPGDLYHGIPTIKLVDNLFLFGNVVKVPIDATVVDIMVFHEAWPILGHLELFAVAGGCLIEASNRWRGRHVNLEKSGVVWTVRDDIAALMPIWERIVSELRRLGLVDKATGGMKTGPTRATCRRLLELLARRNADIAAKGSTLAFSLVYKADGIELDDDTIKVVPKPLRDGWAKRTLRISYDDFTVQWAPARRDEFREYYTELEKSFRTSGRTSERR